MGNLKLPEDHSTPEFWGDAKSALLKVWIQEGASFSKLIMESETAAWHPGGFMIFDVPAPLLRANIRLHVWPRGGRKGLYPPNDSTGELEDGAIHNHVWRISSFCLLGYRDVIVKLNSLAKRNSLIGGPYQAYEVEYRSPTDQQFSPVGGTTEVEVEAYREIASGTFHQIEAGVLHVPLVPIGSPAATLVLRSAPIVAGGPLVLFSDPPNSSVRRDEVTKQDRAKACEVMSEALAALDEVELDQ